MGAVKQWQLEQHEKEMREEIAAGLRCGICLDTEGCFCEWDEEDDDPSDSDIEEMELDRYIDSLDDPDRCC